MNKITKNFNVDRRLFIEGTTKFNTALLTHLPQLSCDNFYTTYFSRKKVAATYVDRIHEKVAVNIYDLF